MPSPWRVSRVLKHTLRPGLVLTIAACGAASPPASAQTTVPALWTAGGLDAGSGGAGQAARMASDAAGNLAIVSGPAGGRDLAVTSYTPDGTLRWRRTVSPASGTFAGDWVVTAPDGEVVALGHPVDSSGRPIGITLLRYTIDGTLRWRADLAPLFPSVARLVVDAAGDAYVGFSALGDGRDIAVHKYGTAGDLVWAHAINTGPVTMDLASSLALSPDGADVVVTGTVGATWIVASLDAQTGSRRWLVTAPEGPAARDVVVDASRVYVVGQGVTGAGTPAITYTLTVVAYSRASGTRLWRTDSAPAGSQAAGHRIALAPDGSVVVAGAHSSGGYLDWWTVALEASGGVRWAARRDRALTGDEIPSSVLVRDDGTTVVSGIGGPVVRDALGNSYMQGVTAGYGPGAFPLWEAFSRLGTVWMAELPGNDLCATGGYDALVTCWRLTAPAAPPTSPSGLVATPLSRSSIRLAWTNTDTTQLEVAIERCRGARCTNFAQVAVVPGTAAQFTDTGLAARTTYKYRVRARGAAGLSPYSNVASARTLR